MIRYTLKGIERSGQAVIGDRWLMRRSGKQISRSSLLGGIRERSGISWERAMENRWGKAEWAVQKRKKVQRVVARKGRCGGGAKLANAN
ncbi:hypothetical protein PV327_005686 [Microctonus hyperodae]|uniref:Uncharacterized protein n=1 Tax=Microctonus hyperodae TaxID=165561 RepID=A0AA39G268_MICHY|nr:hypothetical protein PV327_005686 [Microctonus hyperodae]